MALASVADLKKYMDITFSNTQEEAALMILTGLEADLEHYIGRPVTAASFSETYVAEANYTGSSAYSFFYDYNIDRTLTTVTDVTKPPYVLYTRQTPIVSVASVTVQGQTDSSATTQTVGNDYVVRRYGIDMFRVNDNDKIVINYTAGLDSTADNTSALKLVILRAASREVQNLHDDVVGMKDLTTRNVAPVETGFTMEELNSVKRWRRVRVA
ncbi:MAG: hypothetical protein CMQ41_15590 [Gammaproteobacteria bacterium]|nr:hypothetical protein [Gammaproteobacteria bacterium]|tara:strand:+ start:1825 stop:2463 length:639 start_codon:yes stop_codon:yes gene_type:complete